MGKEKAGGRNNLEQPRKISRRAFLGGVVGGAAGAGPANLRLLATRLYKWYLMRASSKTTH